jgi:hypothetical protein
VNKTSSGENDSLATKRAFGCRVAMKVKKMRAILNQGLRQGLRPLRVTAIPRCDVASVEASESAVATLVNCALFDLAR